MVYIWASNRIICIRLWRWGHSRRNNHSRLFKRLIRAYRFLLWLSADWVSNHQGGSKGDGEGGFSSKGAVFGESARFRGEDPFYAAGLERAGEERDGEQIASPGVCGAPELLQKLPRTDVSRMSRCFSFQLFLILFLGTFAYWNPFREKEQDVLTVENMLQRGTWNLRINQVSWVWQTNECVFYQTLFILIFITVPCLLTPYPFLTLPS